MSPNNFLATIGIWFIIAQIIGLVSLIFWILQLIRLFKRKDKTAAISILVVGLILILIALIPLFWLFPLLWIPTTISFFLGRSPEEEEINQKDFWCGICNIKYQRDFLGGETAYEGKICRSCLGKKQRGEVQPSRQTQPPAPNEPPIYHEPRYRPKFSMENGGREKRILIRELTRKQSKKNSYLTQFIINLLVLQWLLPLITYLIFWIQLKEKMKTEVLNNPSLTAEISFTTVIKDFYKILTSETYNYGGHAITVSILWKIGIGLAFLVPLIMWIYSLVRFLGAKGEAERLETEIKAL